MLWRVEFIGLMGLQSIPWGFFPTEVRRILTGPKWELKLDFSSKLLYSYGDFTWVLIEPWWD